MKNWLVPTSVKALRGFLGLTGYYRKFIKGYGTISKPLTSLLKKDAFNWNLEAETTFNHLKEVMTRALVLALPNFSKLFIVETDACGKRIGAVLMQEGRPIAYLSKTLAAKNMGLSTYEKKFLALLLAVTKWKHYLQGNHFVIRTDQKSLKHILDQRIDSILQQKWITKLLGLSYEVQYKKGNENRAADALSRVEHNRGESQTNAITTQIPLWLQDVQDSYEGNTLFQTIVQAKTLYNLAFPDYSYEASILRRKRRMCVGSHGGIREKIIKSMHDSALGGHSGINGTYQRVKPLFYWPTLEGDVNTWVKECEVCQRSKHENIPYLGLLQPLPIPDQAWYCISMDFIEGLPPSEGKDSILVIVDRLAKYSHFLPLKHPYTASSIAKTFFDNIYKLHGFPVSIVTDRDRVFTSRFWKELFSMAGVSLDMSSAYHAQTDGQTERVNQCLENYLRCMCLQKPKKWAQWLTLAEFWFNTNFHKGLKTTPVSGLVWVLEKIGIVAYKLALPPGSKIHPVFHVSLLKKKIGSMYFPSISLPDFEDEVFKVYPSAILARRLIPRNNVGVPQVLIQWSHGSPDQATWEDYKDMAAKFPGFNPWEQGSKKGGRDIASTSRNAILKGKCEIERGDLGRQIKGRIELGKQLRDFERNAAVSRKSGNEVAIIS
ncbi:UNVERIFIED_CONTAM: Retrovirus-related Pol polyprotein from transposon [Sesamum calycinum]|uniref:Retrovirus-related Pol polyprotein from transposon n=1 Tax=Sesamum calycinum TaxID=2727403 RepID=A0AAW2MPV8_9LAMI